MCTYIYLVSFTRANIGISRPETLFGWQADLFVYITIHLLNVWTTGFLVTTKRIQTSPIHYSQSAVALLITYRQLYQPQANWYLSYKDLVITY